MPIRMVFDKTLPGLFGQGVSSPVFVCDACGERVENARMGAYVWARGRDAEPGGTDVLIVHKGRERGCHRAVEAALEAEGLQASWEELTHFPMYLARNMVPDTADVRYDVVERPVGSSGARR